MKKCTKCRTYRALDEFGKHKGAPDGLMYKCKECVKVYNEVWHKGNRENRRARMAANRLLCRDICGHVCQHCGSTDNLEFHHVDPSSKNFKIANYFHYVDTEKLLTEAELCITLCRSCHEKVHYG